jgi:hypothetical protein
MAVVVLVSATAASGCSYNTFVSQEEAVKAQWAQVENQLKRRSDLIPNLVETTKGFAQQERDVFTAIADSRAKLAGARTPAETMTAANEQSSALARLLVVTENYPELRSSEIFARLSDELAASPPNGCATTSACRPTTPRGEASPPTSRTPSSASRTTRSSRRRPRPKKSRRWISRGRRPASRGVGHERQSVEPRSFDGERRRALRQHGRHGRHLPREHT